MGTNSILLQLVTAIPIVHWLVEQLEVEYIIPPSNIWSLVVPDQSAPGKPLLQDAAGFQKGSCFSPSVHLDSLIRSGFEQLHHPALVPPLSVTNT